jgi:hypothetical protein
MLFEWPAHARPDINLSNRLSRGKQRGRQWLTAWFAGRYLGWRLFSWSWPLGPLGRERRPARIRTRRGVSWSAEPLKNGLKNGARITRGDAHVNCCAPEWTASAASGRGTVPAGRPAVEEFPADPDRPLELPRNAGRIRHVYGHQSKRRARRAENCRGRPGRSGFRVIGRQARAICFRLSRVSPPDALKWRAWNRRRATPCGMRLWTGEPAGHALVHYAHEAHKSCVG